ncbi:MAG TPA: amidohydrolase [Actinomycetota bacterium]|nr:amidohydrolase [Actinomycetota bacterium]
MSLLVRAPRAWFGAGAVDDAAVLLHDGVVSFAGRRRDAPRAGEGAAPEELWVDGFLMPAVADRHVHIRLSDAAAVLFGGVAAVRDLAWIPDEIFALAEASELPSFNGPLVRAAGPMLTGLGGYPTRAEWAPALAARELHGPEDAANVVRLLAERGAAVIKVSLNAEEGPTPTDAELVAVVDTAHGLGLPVTAHTQGSGQVERGLGAGIDELAHCPWTERLGEDVIEALADRVRIVSTLDIWSFGEITEELRIAADNLTRFRNAGGTVVYGTDLGNGAVPPGIDVREAFLLHEACRMPVEDVLTAMVAGSLRPGAPGDLVGLAADPFDGLAALGDLRLVMRVGRIIRRT